MAFFWRWAATRVGPFGVETCCRQKEIAGWTAANALWGSLGLSRGVYMGMCTFEGLRTGHSPDPKTRKTKQKLRADEEYEPAKAAQLESSIDPTLNPNDMTLKDVRSRRSTNSVTVRSLDQWQHGNHWTHYAANLKDRRDSLRFAGLDAGTVTPSGSPLHRRGFEPGRR